MCGIVFAVYFFQYLFKFIINIQYKIYLPELAKFGVNQLGCQNVIKKDVAYREIKRKIASLEEDNDYKKSWIFKEPTVLSMYCFCKQKHHQGVNFDDITFDDGQKYCHIWESENKKIVLLQNLPILLVATTNVLS